MTMDSPLNGLDVSGLEGLLDNMAEVRERWAFVVTAEYRVAIQTLASLSLVSSLLVLCVMLWVRLWHRSYFKRLSLRVSGYVAFADLLSAISELLMMNTNLMLRQNEHGLRFILWLSMFSSLLFVFLTLCMAIQLHLSTLTRVRVGVYMKLEQWYVPLSTLASVVLPAIAVAQMKGVMWVPWMHAFNWPVDAWKRKLVLWSCHFVWITITVVYTACVASVLAMVIRRMWRNSVDVVAEPRVPEKWDWARLTASVRPSEDTMASHDTELSHGTVSSGSTLHDVSRGSEPKVMSGYVLTLMSNDALTGRPIAVRSYVDKKRFLRSVQRLVLYPLVPVITQLGVVACNMTDEPSRALYIYGTAMSAASGVFNLAVFLLNPALPEIVAERVARRS